MEDKAIRLVSLAALCCTTLIVSGCTDPSYHETPPVEVETPRGTVTCQLYTREILHWDRAILAPTGMSIPEADRICRDEGLRRKTAD